MLLSLIVVSLQASTAPEWFSCVLQDQHRPQKVSLPWGWQDCCFFQRSWAASGTRYFLFSCLTCCDPYLVFFPWHGSIRHTLSRATKGCELKGHSARNSRCCSSKWFYFWSIICYVFQISLQAVWHRCEQPHFYRRVPKAVCACVLWWRIYCRLNVNQVKSNLNKNTALNPDGRCCNFTFMALT